MRFDLIDRAKKDFPVQRLCRAVYECVEHRRAGRLMTQ